MLWWGCQVRWGKGGVTPKDWYQAMAWLWDRATVLRFTDCVLYDI